MLTPIILDGELTMVDLDRYDIVWDDPKEPDGTLVRIGTLNGTPLYSNQGAA